MAFSLASVFSLVAFSFSWFSIRRRVGDLHRETVLPGAAFFFHLLDLHHDADHEGQDPMSPAKILMKGKRDIPVSEFLERRATVGLEV